MNGIKLSNQEPETRFQLECSLSNYSRSILRERLKTEGIPITSSALDNAAEIYSARLLDTLEIRLSNLIEADISNLKVIIDKTKLQLNSK